MYNTRYSTDVQTDQFYGQSLAGKKCTIHGFFMHILNEFVRYIAVSPYTVFRIRIHMFLGLPDPDPLVKGTVRKTFYLLFVTSL
jgi:hypothetical protein